MQADSTTASVVSSTIATIVQDPIISTMTAVMKDNIIQFPFDIISQVKDFYEICWSKLMWFIGIIGAISILILGYIGYFIPKKQDKKFKELLFEQKKLFDEQMNRQTEEFENKIKMIEGLSYQTSSGLYRNSAVIISSISADISIIFKLWCSALEDFLKIGDSIYTKEYMDDMAIILKSINELLNKDNKNFIDKNRLKEIVHILKNIDKTKIGADSEDYINNISKFYNTL